MAELTAAERKWLNEVQKVLNRCPSTRLGFFTIGDKDVFVYDKRLDKQITKSSLGSASPVLRRILSQASSAVPATMA
ncbi:hypothetical protein V8M30_000246 [Serratia marcescens]